MEYKLPTIKSQMPLTIGRAQVKALVAHCPECLAALRQSGMRGFVLKDGNSASIVANAHCVNCGHTAKVELSADASGRIECSVDGHLAYYHYGSGLRGLLRTAATFVTLLYYKVLRGAKVKLPAHAKSPDLGVARVRILSSSEVVVGELKGYRIPEWVEPNTGGQFYFDRTAEDLKKAIAERRPDELVLYPGLIYRPR